MKNKLIILSILLGISNFLVGQTDFRDGYIIQNNQDTIHGLIDYRGEKSNSLKCYFKVTQEATPMVYKPDDIYGYRFADDKFYVSKEIKTNGFYEKKFLEFLVHGIVDLFCCKEPNSVRFFIQKPGDQLIELEQTWHDYFLNNKEYQMTSDEYKDSLKYLFQDAPLIQQKLKTLPLDRKSLIDITEEYHYQVCNDKKCIIYKKKLPEINVSFGLLGGGDYTTIFKSNSLIKLVEPCEVVFHCNYNISKSLTGGFYVAVPFPYSKKLSFQYSALLSNISIQSQYEFYKGDGIYSINYKSIHNNFKVKYNFLKSKFTPVIFAGGSINLNFNVKYIDFPVFLFGIYDGTNSYTENKVLNPFSNHCYFGLNAGVGFAYKFANKQEIFCHLILSCDYDILDYLKSNSIQLQLGIPIFQTKSFRAQF